MACQGLHNPFLKKNPNFSPLSECIDLTDTPKKQCEDKAGKKHQEASEDEVSGDKREEDEDEKGAEAQSEEDEDERGAEEKSEEDEEQEDQQSDKNEDEKGAEEMSEEADDVMGIEEEIEEDEEQENDKGEDKEDEDEEASSHAPASPPPISPQPGPDLSSDDDSSGDDNCIPEQPNDTNEIMQAAQHMLDYLNAMEERQKRQKDWETLHHQLESITQEVTSDLSEEEKTVKENKMWEVLMKLQKLREASDEAAGDPTPPLTRRE